MIAEKKVVKTWSVTPEGYARLEYRGVAFLLKGAVVAEPELLPAVQPGFRRVYREQSVSLTGLEIRFGSVDEEIAPPDVQPDFVVGE